MLSLQRTIGNAATTRLLRSARPSRRMIQRWDSPGPVAPGAPAPGPSAPRIVLRAHGRARPGGGSAPASFPASFAETMKSGTTEQKDALTRGLTYGEVV